MNSNSIKDFLTKSINNWSQSIKELFNMPLSQIVAGIIIFFILFLPFVILALYLFKRNNAWGILPFILPFCIFSQSLMFVAIILAIITFNIWRKKGAKRK